MPEHDPKSTVVYVVGFAATVCLVCAVLVAGAAVGLKPMQDRNARVDRLTRVLEVAGLVNDGEQLGPDEVLARFEQNIEARVVELESGAYNEDIDPSNFVQRRAASDPATSKKAPANAAKVMRLPDNALVYHVKRDGALDKIILPIQGYGLWSVMYGFIALERDADTVAGITFYEHGETPGLGGEIENRGWQAKWQGRKVYGSKGDVRLEVIKGSAPPAPDAPYRVDGLSGATITSRGVTNTLEFWLGEAAFGPYLDRLKKREGATS
ncbi:MAG: Na(+)-translocating NADH-quinone reductase subunit C [Myxococcota bacterium]